MALFLGKVLSFDLYLCRAEGQKARMIRSMLQGVALLVAYVVLAGLGLNLGLIQGTVAPLWLANALAVAALTLWGLRLWPAVTIGTLIEVFFFTENPVPIAVGIAAGHTLEVVVGALVLRRLDVRGEVTRVRDAMAILAVTAMLPMFSATNGVLWLTLNGLSTWDRKARVWLVWWLGDFMGALILLPLLLAWMGRRSPVRYPARPFEFAGVVGLAAVLTSFVYLNADTLAVLGEPTLPLSAFLFPPMIWAVLRLRPRENTVVLALASGLAVVFSVAGTVGETIGPLLSLHMVLLAVIGGSLLLNGAEAQIRALNAELEKRVKERTNQLEEANEALLKSNTELKYFAHAMAHDLQTPLRSIAGFAQLLQKDVQGKVNEQVDMWSAAVVENTKRLQTLIQDLLSYTRLEAQGLPFVMTDLKKVFDEVVSSLAVLIDETQAEVSCSTLPTLPADRTQMAQVFQNLIENGIKYNRSKPVRVAVAGELRGDQWVFSVADNGIGIDPKHFDRVFELFKRLHPYHEFPGTGIGVPLCRRIIERHGGHMWIESRPGEGSTFYFSLPMKRNEGP